MTAFSFKFPVTVVNKNIDHLKRKNKIFISDENGVVSQSKGKCDLIFGK